MSDELKAFLKAWYDWATNGAPENNEHDFKRWRGLCASVLNNSINADDSCELYSEFRRMLKAEFPGRAAWHYPFGGRQQYNQDSANHAQHLNPQRLEWVRSKIDG